MLIPIVLFPLIGVGVAYVLVPKMYQSTASLWALHRYEVISPTGPESDLTATPAQTQATELEDLLQTRSFTLQVLAGIDLAPTLNLSSSVLNDPQQLQDALFLELAKNVVPTAVGYQLFTVSYTNRNPQIAQQVIQSVIQNYGTQGQRLSVEEGNNLLTSYQAQLKQAQLQEEQAVAAEEQYVSSHSRLSQAELAADPRYQQLDVATKQAQANVQNIQDQINTIQQSIGANSSGVNTLFQVVDPAQVPQLPQSRKTKFLMGGGIGLAIALLADAIYLIILVRRDRSIYSAYDLQGVVSIPVLMQLPTLTPASTTLLTSNQLVD
jgi:hypothetical protein